MKDVINFYRQVTDGQKLAEAAIPEALADALPVEKVLSVSEALEMGVDLTSVTNSGERFISDADIVRMRRMNAIAKGEANKDEEGNLWVPTMECLREKAEKPELKPALLFWETVDSKEQSPSAEALSVDSAVATGYLPAAIPTASVFYPQVEGNEQFKKKEGPSSGSNDFPSAKCAEQIVATSFLHREGGELYIFFESGGYYRKLEKGALSVLIDEKVGREIRKANKAKAYGEIEKFLKSDIRLEVRDVNRLPLNIWAFRRQFLDITSGQVMGNNGQFYIHSALQCDYFPQAECPVFEAFLEAVSGGDPILVEVLWETLGYILSADNSAKAFFALIGPKDTGKSLFANIVSKFFPDDAISLLGASDFSGKFNVCELKGKRLNECMDLPDVPLSPVAVGKIKALTGGDIVRSDVKYRSSVTFRSEAKLLFGSNSLLRTEVPDQAFTDRLITIPFSYPVPKEHQDKQLEEKITCELSGIVNKAIAAYLRLRGNNYIFPEIEGLENWDQNYDFDQIVLSFAKQECVFSSEVRVSTEELFHAFSLFCQRTRVGIIQKNDFSARFNRLFAGQILKKKIKFKDAALQGYEGVELRR